MLAIGNDELGDPLGSEIICPHCKETHPVEYGKVVQPDGTLVASDLLAFYKCAGNLYLCGIRGKAII